MLPLIIEGLEGAAEAATAGSVGAKLTQHQGHEPAKHVTDNLGILGKAAQQKYQASDIGPGETADAAPLHSELTDRSTRGLLAKAISILESIETTVKAQLKIDRKSNIRSDHLAREREVEQERDAVRVPSEDGDHPKSSSFGLLGTLAGVGVLAVLLASALSKPVAQAIKEALGIKTGPEGESTIPIPGTNHEITVDPGNFARQYHYLKGKIEEGVEDLTMPEEHGKGSGYKPATIIPQPIANDVAFQQRVTKSAKKFNIPEDDLYKVMNFESGGTFSPKKYNKYHTAVGLIQFYKGQGTADVGKSMLQLSKMSRTEQMDYVDSYLSHHHLDKVENPTLSDLYMTVFYPKAVGKPGSYVIAKRGSSIYKQNSYLDTNQDGKITKDEVTEAVRKRSMKGYRAQPATKVKEDSKPHGKPIKPKDPVSGPKEYKRTVDENGYWWQSNNGKPWVLLKTGYEEDVQKPKMIQASVDKAEALDAATKINNNVTNITNNNNTIVASPNKQAVVKDATMPARVPSPSASWGQDYHTYFGTLT